MKLVLDTHIYCDFAEGIPEVVEAMAEFGENLFMPSIVLGELNYGFMKGKKGNRMKKAVPGHPSAPAGRDSLFPGFPGAEPFIGCHGGMGRCGRLSAFVRIS